MQDGRFSAGAWVGGPKPGLTSLSQTVLHPHHSGQGRLRILPDMAWGVWVTSGHRWRTGHLGWSPSGRRGGAVTNLGRREETRGPLDTAYRPAGHLQALLGLSLVFAGSLLALSQAAHPRWGSVGSVPRLELPSPSASWWITLSAGRAKPFPMRGRLGAWGPHLTVVRDSQVVRPGPARPLGAVRNLAGMWCTITAPRDRETNPSRLPSED